MPRGNFLRFFRANAPQKEVTRDDEGNTGPIYVRGSVLEFGDGASATGAVNSIALGPGTTNTASNVLVAGAGRNDEILGASDAVFSQQVFGESTDTDYVAGAAAVAANQGPLSVLDLPTGSAGAVNLATAAALNAAFPELIVGSSWIWFVQNNLGSAGAATLTASTGHAIDADSTAAIADQNTAIVLTRKTGATNYVSRVVGRGVH